MIGWRKLLNNPMRARARRIRQAAKRMKNKKKGYDKRS